MHPGKTTVTLERGKTIVVIKGVPAYVCENCADYYLSKKVTRKVLSVGENAVKSGAEVEIVRFAV